MRLFLFIFKSLATTYSPTNTLRSTISDQVLNFRVRHVSGCVHFSIITSNYFFTPNTFTTYIKKS